ncbi:hypothetical protein Trydic_g3156 [Trypoxylus dichotomus]
MAKLLLACVFLYCSTIAFAELQCYNCQTSTCDFDKVENRVTCGKSGVGDPACLKFVYKDKSGAENISRKCILLNPKETFKCTLPAGATEEFCGTCKDNLCNGADGRKMNVYSVLMATTASIFLVKFFS